MAVKRYPCIFADPLIKTEVNPRLAATGKTVPYGAFQRTWRAQHCATLNPYGSEDCPYEPRDCVIAYWKTAADALDAKTSPIGLFKILARRRGYDRAENKPLARERDEAGAGRSDHQTRQGLSRPTSGFVRAGEVLRALHDGARQRRVDEGEEGSR